MQIVEEIQWRATKSFHLSKNIATYYKKLPLIYQVYMQYYQLRIDPIMTYKILQIKFISVKIIFSL